MTAGEIVQVFVAKPVLARDVAEAGLVSVIGTLEVFTAVKAMSNNSPTAVSIIEPRYGMLCKSLSISYISQKI